MSADVIPYNRRAPNPGNGAREAMIECLPVVDPLSHENEVDLLLAALWARGFKVVPVDGGDVA